METRLIQVFEHQRLKISDSSLFTPKLWEAMVKFNELHQNKYFTVIHNGVQFNSFVGVMQIGRTTIEILPKADNREVSSASHKHMWQNILLQILHRCNRISIDSVSETLLTKRYSSILEAYFDMYLSEVEYLVHAGLIKKYRRVQENQKALRGKLVFSKNIQKNTVHKELFYCEHQVYDRDHLLNQILFRALTVLQSFLPLSKKDRLNRLLLEFKDFRKVNINTTHFNSLSWDRKTGRYARAIEIAKIIILNYSPAITLGTDNMLTLLFDMNQLWEEYIYRILQRHKESGMAVSFQNKDNFWENKTIRPDIVLRTNNQNFVIDTKWKIINANSPADADLKQMFAYNLHWKAEKSMLLYPRTNQDDTHFGKFHHEPKDILDDRGSLKSVALGNRCKLGFIDLVANGGLRNERDIAAEIFSKLLA